MNRQTSPWALALLLGATVLFSIGCGDDSLAGDLDGSVVLDAGLDGGPQDSEDAGPQPSDDGGAQEPDGGSGKPDGGPPESDGGSLSPDGGPSDSDGGSEEPDEQPSITISSFGASSAKVQAGQTLEIAWAVIGPAHAEVTLLRGSTELYQGSDLHHQLTTPAWVEHADLTLKVSYGQITEQARLTVVVEPVIQSFRLDGFPLIGKAAPLSYAVIGPSDTTVKLVEGSATVWEASSLTGTGATPVLEGATSLTLRAESTRGGEVVSDELAIVPSYEFVNTSSLTSGMNRAAQSFDLNADKATSVYVPAYGEYRGLSYRIEGPGAVTGPTKHIYVRKAVQGTETATRTYKINEGAVEATVFDLEPNEAYVVTLDSLDSVTDFKLMTLPSVCPGDTDKMIGACWDATLNANVVTSCIERKNANGDDLTQGTCAPWTSMPSGTMDAQAAGTAIVAPTTLTAANDFKSYFNSKIQISPTINPSHHHLRFYAGILGTSSDGTVLDYRHHCELRDSMGFVLSSIARDQSDSMNGLINHELKRSVSSITWECSFTSNSPNMWFLVYDFELI